MTVKKRMSKIVIFFLLGLTAFVLVFLMSMIGVGLWKKSAQYPPTTDQIEARASLSLIGLAQDHLGLALWQADGQGAETKAFGHTVELSQGKRTARYYLSTRDYRDIDPRSSAGLQGSEPVAGFNNFVTVLQKHGFQLSDVQFSFPLCSLGEDIEFETWSTNDETETRSIVCSSSILMEVAGERMVSIPCEWFIMTLSYHLPDGSQPSFSLISEEVYPVNISEVSSEKIQNVAQEFMADTGTSKVRLVVDKGRILDQTFSGKGRIDGLYGEVLVGRLEILL
ncbi:hypothetical protein ACFL6A_03180 [bacterium]